MTAIARVIATNLWGVIHGTKAFLPHLIASGDRHVVNVSSLNGIASSGSGPVRPPGSVTAALPLPPRRGRRATILAGNAVRAIEVAIRGRGHEGRDGR